MKGIVMLSICALCAAGLSTAAPSQPSSSKSMDMNQMDTKSMDKMDKGMKQKPATEHSGTGVVKNVDPAAGSITLAHEPIKSLNWPAMTMAFKVKDNSLLDKAKPGEKVHFTLEKSGKDYVVPGIR